MMIYFIQGEKTGLVKIGKATNPETRLCALQIGSPDALKILKVAEGGRGVESMYHERFRSDWKMGEWFNPSKTLLAFIASLPESEWDGLKRKAGNAKAAPRRSIKTVRAVSSRDADKLMNAVMIGGIAPFRAAFSDETFEDLTDAIRSVIHKAFKKALLSQRQHARISELISQARSEGFNFRDFLETEENRTALEATRV